MIIRLLSKKHSFLSIIWNLSLSKVTAAIAKEFAESEFEKYRVIQDSLYESDFDKLMNDMEKDGTNDQI